MSLTCLAINLIIKKSQKFRKGGNASFDRHYCDRDMNEARKSKSAGAAYSSTSLVYICWPFNTL